MEFFSQLVKGVFIKRINTFLVECVVGDKEVIAHLPNPGRMIELLIPGSIMYLTEASSDNKKTAYTAVAIEKQGQPVILDTHVSNTVVRRLIEENRIPGFEGARIIKQEATFGLSRFDFLLELNNTKVILEVKSCTLFGDNIAMFPDAVTERGRKHLNELAALSREGYISVIIFLVHSSQVDYFIPDYHTDLHFARTLYDFRKDLIINAIGINWNKNLTLREDIRSLYIPWSLIEREVEDSGVYIIVLYLPKASTIDIGKLGPIYFNEGYYLYVGSAKTNLTKRMARHARKRKKHHWHIDYLRDKAIFYKSVAIRCSASLEHELAQAVKDITEWSIKGFGCSDCCCESHLFGSSRNPFEMPAFINLLQKFRIDRLETEIEKVNK